MLEYEYNATATSMYQILQDATKSITKLNDRI